MSTVKTSIVIPSNPADLKKILAAIVEADNSLTRIDAEKDQIKAIIDDLSEKYPDLGKKFIAWAIKRYHKGDVEVLTAETDEFSGAFESIIK